DGGEGAGREHHGVTRERRDMRLRERTLRREYRDRLNAGGDGGREQMRAFDDDAALGTPQARVAREPRPALHARVVARADDQAVRFERSSCRALRSIWSTRSTCDAATAVERTSA